MYAEQWEIGTILSESWEKFKEHAAVLLICVVIAGAVNFVFSMAGNVLQQVGPIMAQSGLDQEAILVVTVLLQFIVSFLSWLAQTWFTLGLAKISLKVARGQEPAVGDMFSIGNLYLSGLLAGLLVGLATLAGFCLLIVPGVIVALGTMMYLYAIVDQDLGPIESIKESWRLTEGEKGRLFLWSLTVLGLMLAGFLVCCVGMLVTGPLCGIGTAMIYDKLKAQKGLEGGGDDASWDRPAPASRASATGDAPLSAKN